MVGGWRPPTLCSLTVFYLAPCMLSTFGERNEIFKILKKGFRCCTQCSPYIFIRELFLCLLPDDPHSYYSVPRRRFSADKDGVFRSEALPVDVVLLQFFVAGVPESGQDALHVQGIHSVGRHHTMVNLHQKKWFRKIFNCTRPVLVKWGQFSSTYVTKVLLG